MYPILGQLFALLTAACWAHNSIVYAKAGHRVGSQAVTHIRLWVALPAMALLHLMMRGSLFPFGFTPFVYLMLGLSGFFGFFIADILIFRAYVEIGPRETMVIMTLSPIFGTLLSWIFLAEYLTILQIGGILTTIAGVSWVILEEGARERGARKEAALALAKSGALQEVQEAADGSQGKLPEAPHNTRSAKTLGILLALGGAMTQAVGMFFAKAGLVQGLHPVSGNLIRLTAGLGGLVLYTALRGTLIQDFRRMKDRTALLLIASGAIIGPVFGILLSLYALTWAPVGIVTALMQTSPIWLLPADRFLFKKVITPGAVAGTLVAIGGTVLMFL